MSIKVNNIKRSYNEYDGISERLRDSRGFTLAEALIATLIMLLVTVIVATGIPAASRAYDRVVMASNAEVLLSTTMSELRNELTLAKDIDIQDADGDYVVGTNGVKSGAGIIYYNPQTGTKSRITCNGRDIMYERYVADDLIIKESELESGSDAAKAYKDSKDKPVRFMSEAVSDRDKELHVQFTGVSYDENTGVVKFSGLSVTRKDGDTKLTEREDGYSIRIITE